MPKDSKWTRLEWKVNVRVLSSAQKGLRGRESPAAPRYLRGFGEPGVELVRTRCAIYIADTRHRILPRGPLLPGVLDRSATE
jgi:hypothetical protein